MKLENCAMRFPGRAPGRGWMPFLAGGWAILAAGLIAGVAGDVQAGDLKFEAHLVWGADQTKEARAGCKPVQPEIQNKLRELPLKWTQYFEVKRTNFFVADKSTIKVAMSEKCDVEVKNLAGSNVEVTLFGKGKEVMKRKQSLPKGEMLVLGGNAPNATAWLVILKRIE